MKLEKYSVFEHSRTRFKNRSFQTFSINQVIGICIFAVYLSCPGLDPVSTGDKGNLRGVVKLVLGHYLKNSTIILIPPAAIAVFMLSYNYGWDPDT
jgi:hypothetical protein